MPRTLSLYARALLRHWYALSIGPISLLLTLTGTSVHLALGAAIAVLLAGVPIAGFLAWREEHRKVPPTDAVLALRRGPFEEQLTKLSPTEKKVLRELVGYGRLNNQQAGEFLRDSQIMVGGLPQHNTGEAEQILRGIERRTSLIEMHASGYWQMSPEMEPLLLEWAVNTQ